LFGYWKLIMKMFFRMEKGQVIIPVKIRERLGIASKTWLEVKLIEGNRILIEPLRKARLKASAVSFLGKAANDYKIYWQKGDKESLAKLKKYCEMDVEITKDIYDFGKENGFLKFIDFWNDTREVKVDFSYPPEDQSAQNSLF